MGYPRVTVTDELVDVGIIPGVTLFPLIPLICLTLVRREEGVTPGYSYKESTDTSIWNSSGNRRVPERTFSTPTTRSGTRCHRGSDEFSPVSRGFRTRNLVSRSTSIVDDSVVSWYCRLDLPSHPPSLRSSQHRTFIQTVGVCTRQTFLYRVDLDPRTVSL